MFASAASAPVRRPAGTRRPRSFIVGLVALAVALIAPTIVAASTEALTEVDLATYKRVGRHDLPEPTRTTAPPGSSLAQEASAVTYNWDADTLFVVGDAGTSLVQVDKSGGLIDSMTLAPGGSPQGTTFYDTEGLAYVGDGMFVMTEERDRQLVRFTYAPGTTLTRADVDTVKLGTTTGNVGLEGVTNDPKSGGFVLVKEDEPQSVFETGIDWALGTATNGAPTAEGSIDLFDPALAGLADLSEVFALANLSTLTGPETSNLLILSQESGRIVNIDRSGSVSSSLTIVADPGNPLSVAQQTHEGLTMDDDGNLYVVSESGGGDADHPQLWVYEHSTEPNQAPTGVTLTEQTTSLPENTSTEARVTVANLVVEDDGLGTNQLAVTGPDASSFEVDSNGLYLKAGTALDHEAKSTYTVSVTVDDPSLGESPDATSQPFTLTITPVSVADPTTVVAVTEASPWSSGNSPYGADWWELTNTGTTTVDLSGWRMDDDSSSFANSVALNGFASLAPGQSAIFIEGTAPTADAFTGFWFGGSVPAGFQIGTYSGSGIGLSTGGDEVNIFDASGERVTGVAFGSSTSGLSFDNSAALGSATGPVPTISTLSADGVNGAFTADGETGSPGTAAVPTPVIVSEVAPWGSGASSPYGADWWELTNNTAESIDLSGWKMDDSSDSFANSVALNGVSSLAPGQSAIFIEGDSTTTAAFTSFWFGTGVPPGFQIGAYSGSGVGLGNGGDQVNIFNAEGERLTGVAFGAATTNVSFDNAAALGSFTPPSPVITVLSVDGVNGAFIAQDQIGSPGAIASAGPPAVAVTEASPWSSGNSPYGADWWELTNTGTTTVDLSGWRMDDDSSSFANSVALNGLSSLAPGQSAILIEGTAATADAFTGFWFGGSVPAGYQIGTYSGSGIGLSTGGDEVNIFDAGGERVTGVSFGASTTGFTFDNAEGLGSTTQPPAMISTLSAVGVNGAFTVSGETGSPGTIAQQGVGPQLSADPPTFPVQPVGTIGPGQWVVATNTGDANVQIAGAAIREADDDSAGDFLLTADRCTGETLAPTETCRVQIRFAPSREEATSSANLEISSSAPDSPTLVQLTGTSTAPPSGPPGANGNTIHYGTGAPPNSTGNDGDFYIDVANRMLYGPKADGEWPETGISLVGPPGEDGGDGDPGTPGADGNTIYSGTGPPPDSLGRDGDFYIDTDGPTLYGPKGASGWGTGVSLVGPAGPSVLVKPKLTSRSSFKVKVPKRTMAIPVTIANPSDEAMNKASLCVRGPKRYLTVKGGKCKVLNSLAAGRSVERTVKLRLKKSLSGERAKVTLKLAIPGGSTVEKRIRLRGKR